MSKATVLIARILLAQMFLVSGINKIMSYEGTIQYMASAGLPGWLLPVVILVEIVGAVMLIIGFKTRWAAWMLAGFTLVAALTFHTNFGDQVQMIMFMKNLCIAGGMLVLAEHGPGRISIDRQ